MKLNDVMSQIADRLRVTGKFQQVNDRPVDQVVVPAASVSLPVITFDGTYGRGMDRYEVPVIVVVGKVSDRAARDVMAGFVAGAGPASVKAVLESGNYTAFDTLRVARVEFDVVTISAIDYLEATFTVEITGAGAS